jgi:general secretion pathway protein F
MRFELRTITPEGRIESLECNAADERSARAQAEGRGHTVVSVTARRELVAFWRGSQARFPLELFSQELLVLVAAGIPLVESIETLAQKEHRDEFRSVLQGVITRLRQGQPLSAALESAPQAFPPLYVATVRAAERTSDLVPALQRYVEYRGRIEAIRKRVLNASIYPALLISVGGLVSLFLLFHVVPRFGRIYAERGEDLPVFSRLLLSWSQLIEGQAGLALAALAGLVAAAIYALRQPSARAALSDALWRLPGLGERMRVYQLSRLYRTTGMLLKGGMPLVSALEMGADLLNLVLRERLVAASRAIREGQGVRIKVMAEVLSARHRREAVPQDGRFKVQLKRPRPSTSASRSCRRSTARTRSCASSTRSR